MVRARHRRAGLARAAAAPPRSCSRPTVSTRVRLLYLYPSEVRDPLIATMLELADRRPLLRPLAAARRSALLRRMKRWGSGERFLAMIDDIRAEEPDAAFRSSFIVGFPGETEASTTRCSRSSRPPRSTGPGSSRSRAEDGTPAASLAGCRRRRAWGSGCASAKTCRSRSRAAARDALVGSEIEVLVDGRDDGAANERMRRRPDRSHLPRSARDRRRRAPRRRRGRAPVRSSGARHRRRRSRPGRQGRQAVSAPAAPVRRFGETAIATPANFVTIARLVLAVPTLLLIIDRGSTWLTVSLWFVLTSTDRLDGWLARRDGTTRSGAFLDPLADKFLVIGGFLALGHPRRLLVRRGDHRHRARGRHLDVPVVRRPARHLAPRAQDRQVEGVLPVPRGRHRAVPAHVRVGDVPRHPAVDRDRAHGALGPRHPAPRVASSRSRRGAMRVDVLAIGTELLLGQIVDTNSSWIGEHLAAVGPRHLRAPQGGRQPRPHGHVPARAARPRRRGHRLRRHRAHARRRHPRGDRRGDGRRARAARGAHRADPAASSAGAAARCPRTTCARPTCPWVAT